jgi:hypothetical protein
MNTANGEEVPMANQSSERQKPLTPWRVVQQRFFTDGLDVVSFCREHRLDEKGVRMVLAELRTDLPPDLCAALSRVTGMEVQYFRHLNDQYKRETT